LAPKKKKKKEKKKTDMAMKALDLIGAMLGVA
jgi:hypothetical protein